jgi:CheY-like chemotaxis protein
MALLPGADHVKPRILCVDDEPMIRAMLADWVEDMGLTAVLADGGEQALAQMDAGAIDLLITDIRMHGLSGWQVAEQARSRRPGLPVIYISGFPSPGEAVPDAIYLAKPFRPHELQAAIRTSLAGPPH